MELVRVFCMVVKVSATLSARFWVPAIEPVATRAATSAYSTRSWPDSSCTKRAKNAGIGCGLIVSRIGSIKGLSLGDSASLYEKLVLMH
jgi:hypothetical protein